jgi:uncharacterized zinc-type alcohol dehydrogenase-like protein
MNLLRVGGTMANLGAFTPLDAVVGASLIRGRRSLTGSLIGRIAETQEVIDCCAARNIRPDVDLIRPDQIAQAYDRVVNKDVHCRFVIDLAAGGAA